jgi:alpha-2,3 sialyltransferase
MDNNILVCGNGPSCREIDFTRIPKNVKVMRMTNFFFEEKYYAGKCVDYYVEYAKRLENQYFNIRTLNEKNEYDIDMENLWWTVLSESNPHFPIIKSCTEFIQKNPMIAEFRCFYEYYYGQYLPTGMQALALAVCLGFKNIYIAGYDLFSNPNHLYAFPVGKRVFETVKNYKHASLYDTASVYDKTSMAASTQAGYEYLQNTHPTSMQVEFLHLLTKLYPKTHILSVCESSAINEHITLAQRLFEKPWYLPLKKPDDRTTDWYPLPDTMPGKRANTT